MDGLKTEPIHTFEKIDDPDGPDVNIEDVQQHASYSWLDIKEPTIAVPGQCLVRFFVLYLRSSTARLPTYMARHATSFQSLKGYR